MSFPYSGWARLNGVSFQSDNFTVHATRKDGKIQVDYSMNEDEHRVITACDGLLSRIPFIRRVWLVIYSLLNQWKFFLASLLCAFLIATGITFFHLKDNDINDTSNLINIQFYIVEIILFAIHQTFKNREISRSGTYVE
ncbi:hypothetical protein [Sporolactobacillus pectinivorans]|uniref:hypothetical protein n=1 Tax=Sporolactobacillus pectinivorans TaxID=1591408 RepID=UPI000C25A05D|nr:hypothetical protein [Sporolactobacillus pectinivorans]